VSNKQIYKEQFTDAVDAFISLRKDLYANPQKYTVDLMAKKINFSKTYFSAKYKQYFKVSPIQDLTQAKMDTVQTLLATKTVFEVANMMNFDSIANFYKWFKKNFGCTPKEYISRYSHTD
jgi:AraC family transcriptional regulator of arabinose operon